MKSFSHATTDPRRNFITYLTHNSITVAFSISAANVDNDMEDDYNWDDEDEGPSGSGDGGMLNEEPDLPIIDSKSGRVMSKPRKSGSPLELLFGAKMSGFGAGEVVAKKKKKGGKKYDPEEMEDFPEEDEFPEEEQYDEESAAEEEDWDEDQGGSRYAPINTRITISKVVSPNSSDFRVMQEH
jgi:hypothetical protein